MRSVLAARNLHRPFLSEGACGIAPAEVEFGGAGVSVNECGVSVCLFDSDPCVMKPCPRRSRGVLLRELAWAESSAECALWINQVDLSPCAPFTLLVLEPGHTAWLASWNGHDLSVDFNGDSRMPVTSSCDAAGICHSRLNELARRVSASGRLDPALLYRLHSSHAPSLGSYSFFCMHRDDAETVSFSW